MNARNNGCHHFWPFSTFSRPIDAQWVLNDGGELCGSPVAVQNEVTNLRGPYQVMAAQVLSVVLGDRHVEIPSCVVEGSLLGFGQDKLHCVCRRDLAEDVSVVEDGLIQDIGVFAGTWLIGLSSPQS